MCDSPRKGCAWRTKLMWREQAEIRWARRGIFIVACCNTGKLCVLAARPFQSQQSGALTRMWRWCQVQPSQKERAMGAVHCKNEGMFLEPFCWRWVEGVVFACPMHEHDQRWTCGLLGFKSCDISIYWWIWMVSFFLNRFGLELIIFSFEILRNFRFRFGSAAYCNFRFSSGTTGYCGLQVSLL